MKSEPTSLVRGRPPLAIRAARFEDVAPVLRLVHGAIERDCRDHYDALQREAVFSVYASNLFVDVVGAFDSLVAELDGRLVGFAQLDRPRGQLRALFVDAESQRRGIGRALLAAIEARVARHGGRSLRGAMSLNAVPFYANAGFRARGPVEALSAAGVSVPIVQMEKRLAA
ncbi:MAG TPA: GNAT family N-acetyltransferase [Polyangia bacterium]|nr:GNAT family N-acetyltransferase [Polyangia bacterium]